MEKVIGVEKDHKGLSSAKLRNMVIDISNKPDVRKQNMKEAADLTIWRLISIRINPETETPELYLLILEGKNDIPLQVNDRIALFTDPAKAGEMITCYASSIPYDDIDIEAPFQCCDIANAMYVLSHCTRDEEGTVGETINLLLDLIKICPVLLPSHYKTILFKIADFFTFDNDAAKLFKQSSFNNTSAVDAVLWCVGAIVTVSFLLDVPVQADLYKKETPP